MFPIMKIAILALCCNLAVSIPFEKSYLLQTSLLKSFLDATATQPTERSLACLEYYIPILSEIVDEYDKSWRACEQSAVDANQAAELSKADQLKQLEASASASCELFENCQTDDGAEPILECYSETGTANAINMYEIAANANEVLNTLREEYRVIENDKYRCTNASERAYVESYTKTMEEMNRCVAGLDPVPINPPVTTTTETTTTETEPTLETTEEPTLAPDNMDDEEAQENIKILVERLRSPNSLRSLRLRNAI